MWPGEKKLEADPYISLNQIVRFTVIFTLMFLVGWAAKGVSPYIYLFVFIVLLFLERPHQAVLLYIFWIYFSNFYYGQGYFSDSMAGKFEKATYLLFIAYFFVKGKYNKHPFTYRLRSIFLVISLIYFFVLTVSFFINNYPIARCLVLFRFLLIFFFILEIQFPVDVYKKLLNSIIAIGIIQIPIAILQFRGDIAPAMRVSNDFTWVANLDDAASGTFGPVMSPDLSWFLSFLTLFLFSLGILKKSWWITLCAFFFLIQYMVVDSKTALIATVFLFLIFFMSLIKNQTKMRLDLTYLYGSVLIIALFSVVFFFSWKAYYKTLNEKTSIRSFETVGNMYTLSYNFVTKNFLQWGKISGYYYVSQMQFEENPIKFFTGFGPGELNYKNAHSRGYRLRSMLPLPIRRNNGLNERSGMITHFAENGMIGAILMLLYFIFLYSFYKNTTFESDIGRNMQTIIGPLMIATFLYYVIYMNGFNSLSMMAFWIFNGSILGIEQNIRSQNVKKT